MGEESELIEPSGSAEAELSAFNHVCNQVSEMMLSLESVSFGRAPVTDSAVAQLPVVNLISDADLQESTSQKAGRTADNQEWLRAITDILHSSGLVDKGLSVVDVDLKSGCFRVSNNKSFACDIRLDGHLLATYKVEVLGSGKVKYVKVEPEIPKYGGPPQPMGQETVLPVGPQRDNKSESKRKNSSAKNELGIAGFELT